MRTLLLSWTFFVSLQSAFAKPPEYKGLEMEIELPPTSEVQIAGRTVPYQPPPACPAKRFLFVIQMPEDAMMRMSLAHKEGLTHRVLSVQPWLSGGSTDITEKTKDTYRLQIHLSAGNLNEKITQVGLGGFGGLAGDRALLEKEHQAVVALSKLASKPDDPTKELKIDEMDLSEAAPVSRGILRKKEEFLKALYMEGPEGKYQLLLAVQFKNSKATSAVVAKQPLSAEDKDALQTLFIALSKAANQDFEFWKELEPSPPPRRPSGGLPDFFPK